MRQKLIDICSRLPKTFYSRVMVVSKINDEPPEVIIDRGLRYEEVLAGVIDDDDLEKTVVAHYYRGVGTRYSKGMSGARRLVRARKGAYQLQAKKAKMDLESFLNMKAAELGMTVEEFLARPKETT